MYDLCAIVWAIFIMITLHMAVSKGVTVTATVVKQWPKSLSIAVPMFFIYTLYSNCSIKMTSFIKILLLITQLLC